MIVILQRPSGVDIDGHIYEREHTDFKSIAEQGA